jgi:hypothetical protein
MDFVVRITPSKGGELTVVDASTVPFGMGIPVFHIR